MSETACAEYRIGKAIVRMHGTPDRERIEAATTKLIKKQWQQQKQKKRRAMNDDHP